MPKSKASNLWTLLAQETCLPTWVLSHGKLLTSEPLLGNLSENIAHLVWEPASWNPCLRTFLEHLQNIQRIFKNTWNPSGICLATPLALESLAPGLRTFWTHLNLLLGKSWQPSSGTLLALVSNAVQELSCLQTLLLRNRQPAYPNPDNNTTRHTLQQLNATLEQDFDSTQDGPWRYKTLWHDFEIRQFACVRWKGMTSTEKGRS